MLDRDSSSDWIRLFPELENRRWKLQNVSPIPCIFPEGAVKADVRKGIGGDMATLEA